MMFHHHLKVLLTLGVGLILSFGAATDTEISFVQSSVSLSQQKGSSLETVKAKRRLHQKQDKRNLFFDGLNSRPSRYSSPTSGITGEDSVSFTDVTTNPDPEYTSIYSRGKGKGKGYQGYRGGKGKGKGGSSSKKSSKGKKGSGSSDGFCDDFDFSGKYRFVSGKGKGKGGYSGKGKGGWRNLQDNQDELSEGETPALQPWQSRELQFDGEGCSPNVYETACNDPDLSIFVRLMEKAGIDRVLECAGPFTLLAPSNSALERNPFLLEFLQHPYNSEELEDFLLYHILPSLYLEQDFRENGYKTLQGDRVQVSTNPLMFNQAGVIRRDMLGCNGVIHKIDDVLITPENGYLPEECAALDFRGPTHSSSREYGNGFFHKRHLQYSGHICELNVLETARLNPDLSIFVDMIELAGLEEVFLCAGPFTALIPTNDAFEQIDEATIDELLLPENRQDLQDLLLFHVLPGVQSSTVVQEGTIPSLSGEEVTVTLQPLEFNGVGVIESDIPACNGIIHILEDVLPTDPSTDPPNTASPVAPGAPTAAPSVGRTSAPTAASDTPAPTVTGTLAPTLASDTPAPTTGGTAAPTQTAVTPAPTTGGTPAPTTGGTAAPTQAAVTPAPTTGGTAAPTQAAVTPAPTTGGTTIAPSLMPSGLGTAAGSSLAPSVGDEFTRVRLTDYYLVYVVELLEETLPEDQLATLITNTQDFFASLFETFYEGTETAFVGVEITPKEVLFGDALPPAETFNDPAAAWNYYLPFDAVVLYDKGSPGIADVATHFDVMAATEDDYIRYILEFARTVPNMASTTQVEFEAIEIIPEETARGQDMDEDSDEKDEVKEEVSEGKGEVKEDVSNEKEEEAVDLSEPEPSPSAPDASKAKVLPLATAAAAVSAFMTLAAASFLMRKRRRSALAADTDRTIKEGNVIDGTVTDETASNASSRSKTREFGREDMETTSWYE